MEVKKILSPLQIAMVTFFGGPIAAVYYLRRNYLHLDKGNYAQNTLIFGVIFFTLLIGISPFLPEGSSGLPIAVSYTFVFTRLAMTTQITKNEIEQSEEYIFESNWKILGVGILALLLFLGISIVLLLGLDAMGLVSIEE